MSSAVLTDSGLALQVRLVNLTKKAGLPFKNHRGRVKSIAVIDPGAPSICSCGYAAALTITAARLSILLSQHLAQNWVACFEYKTRWASLLPAV